MWSIKELKEKGKFAMKANYWKSVLCAFIISLLTQGTTLYSRINSTSDNTQQKVDEITQSLNNLSQSQRLMTAVLVFLTVAGISTIIICVTLLLKIFLLNPLQVGCYGFFNENVRNGDASLDSLGTGFTNYGHTFVTLFLRDLYLVLWTLLFIIPGLVKSYSYRMVPYIVRDEPDLSATEAITLSRQMMDGNKWRAFLFDLSFIGWAILGAITFNLVNIFWTNPYKQNANAALYHELSNLAIEDAEDAEVEEVEEV